jgi:hypothetical protein
MWCPWRDPWIPIGSNHFFLAFFDISFLRQPCLSLS